MAGNRATNEQLTTWVETYKDLVYRIAISQVRQNFAADDIFQEVFMCLMRDSAKLLDADEAHIKNWIMRTTYHRCKDYFRKMRRYNEVDYQDGFMHPEEQEAAVPEQHVLLPCDDPSEEMKEEVYEAVMALSEDMRAVIFLFYYEDLSIREIAGVLELQENAVKTRLHRARKKLEKTLERWGGR